MYNSRRVGRLRPERNKLKDEVAGVALGSVREGSARPRPGAAPPPSLQHHQMKRPSIAPDTLASELTKNDALNSAREQTKKQLESITGRMFQVLNDFEDGSSGGGSQDEHPAKAVSSGIVHSMKSPVATTDDTELKSNIQSMITDYHQTCDEREELLTSLADWFSEGHIDDLVLDAQQRMDADPCDLRESLVNAKMMSERLKAVNVEMEEAAAHSTPTDQLLREKEQLEKELMKSVNEVRVVHKVDVAKQAVDTAAVTASWKFAAGEIFHLLGHVRDTGVGEMQELERKIADMVGSLSQQAETVEKLRAELRQQKELVTFADMTTKKLSNDNLLLKEELEEVRGQLLRARKTMARQHVQRESGEEEEEEGGVVEGSKVTVVEGEMGEGGMSVEVYKAQIADLTRRLAQLQKENEESQTAQQRLLQEAEVLRRQGEEPTTHSDMNPKQDPIPLASIPPAFPPAGPTDEPQCRPSSAVSPHPSTSPTQPLGTSVARSEELETMAAELHSALHERGALEQLLKEKEKELEGVVTERERLRKALADCQQQLLRGHSEAAQSVNLPQPTPAQTPPTGHTHQIRQEERSSVTTPPHISLTLTDTEGNETTPTNTGPLHAQREVVMGGGEEVLGGGEDEFEFTVQAETMPPVAMETPEAPKVQALDLVMDLINKVNENQSEFVAADSMALRQVHRDLQKVCEVITTFLQHSSQLVEEEADAVDTAIESLVTQLPEEAKPVLNQSDQIKEPAGREGCVGEERWQQVRHRVEHFADQAIEMVRAGEKALSSKIHAQQNKLQTVFQAMKQHKRRQPGAFSFPAPQAMEQLGIEAIAVTSFNDLHGNNKISTHEPQRPYHSQLERLKHYHHSPHPLTHTHHTHTGVFPRMHQLSMGLQGLNSHPHRSPLHHPHITPHNFTSPLAEYGLSHQFLSIGTTLARRGEGLGGDGGGRRRRHHKPRPTYPSSAQSAFLQISNSLTPPRTAPARMRDRTSFHGNGTSFAASDRHRLSANNVSAGATFIDLLNQAPLVTQQHHHLGNRQGGVGGVKLPHI